MIDTNKAILTVKAFYIKQRANKTTTEELRTLKRYLTDNTTIEQRRAINDATLLNIYANTAVKKRVQLEREKFYQKHFVKLSYRGGGWYTFSPSGHKYYSRNDEIVVHGFDNLVEQIEQRGLFTLGCKGWSGELEYIGQHPKSFF